MDTFFPSFSIWPWILVLPILLALVPALLPWLCLGKLDDSTRESRMAGRFAAQMIRPAIGCAWLLAGILIVGGFVCPAREKLTLFPVLPWLVFCGVGLIGGAFAGTFGNLRARPKASPAGLIGLGCGALLSLIGATVLTLFAWQAARLAGLSQSGLSQELSAAQPATPDLAGSLNVGLELLGQGGASLCPLRPQLPAPARPAG